MWFDKNAQDVAPQIFTCFEPGTIPLTRRTKYTQYNDLIADFSVKVPGTSDLIGKNHPIFKVTIIPDAVDFFNQFAVIVSISHMVGDGYTYYKVFRMLSAQNPVQTMNPTRHTDFPAQVEAHMGEGEAFYLRKTNPTLVEETLKTSASLIPGKTVATEGAKGVEVDRETLLFTISRSWLDEQLKEVVQGGDDADSASISNSDVILSWWYRTSSADIGLYPHDLRAELPVLNDLDAGNYNNPIPFTKDDYSTPQQIHGAVKVGKRSGSSLSGAPLEPLPRNSSDMSFAVGVDWNKHFPEGTTYEDEEGVVQELHIPLFSVADLHTIPSTMAAFILFTAVTNHQKDDDPPQIGAFVVASKDVCERVAQSGIIDTNMKTSLTSELTNRRGSVIDFGSLPSSLSLEVALDDGDGISNLHADEVDEAHPET